MTRRKANTDEEQEVTMQRLAGTLRMLRESEHLSLREFAEKTGVNHSDLFRLENGTSRNPSIYLIQKLAKAFGMSVDELMKYNVKTCPTCHGSGWVKV